MPKEMYLRRANLCLRWRKFEAIAAGSLGKGVDAENMVRWAGIKNDDVIEVRHNTLNTFNNLVNHSDKPIWCRTTVVLLQVGLSE